MAHIRRTPPRLNSSAVGRAIVVSLTVPFVVVFCIPVLYLADAGPVSTQPAALMKYALPLMVLTIYLALACFSYLNARAGAADIRKVANRLSSQLPPSLP